MQPKNLAQTVSVAGVQEPIGLTESAKSIDLSQSGLLWPSHGGNGQSSRPTLRPGIALGGGAARGLCHIGVLKVLEANKIRFPIIAGTSIGAIIGAAYACGKLEEAEAMARSITPQMVRQWADVDWHGGLLKGDVVKGILHRFTGDLTFQDLRDRGILLTVVACDLETGKAVYLNEGKICEAVRASMSIPGVFVPVKRDGMTLVDGALVDNVPVTALYRMGATFTVAVDVYSSGDIWSRAVDTLRLSTKTVKEIQQRIREMVSDESAKCASYLDRYRSLVTRVLTERFGGNFREAFKPAYLRRIFAKETEACDGKRVDWIHGQTAGATRKPILRKDKKPVSENKTTPGKEGGWTTLRALLAALDIMNSVLEVEKGKESLKFRPNVLITPDIHKFHAHQFYMAKEMISAGEAAARQAIPKMAALIRR